MTHYVFHDEMEAKVFNEILNSLHPYLQSTIEWESDFLIGLST